jgi:hypothetical protein
MKSLTMSKIVPVYVYTALGIGGLVFSVVAVAGGDAALGTYDLVLSLIMFWLGDKAEKRSLESLR